MGKGSMRRPEDEAAFRDGWERVFGTAKENLGVGTRVKQNANHDTQKTLTMVDDTQKEMPVGVSKQKGGKHLRKGVL